MEKRITHAWTKAGLWIVAAVLFCAPLRLAADTLVLKNGNRFEGKILEETPEKVVMQMTYGTMEFKRADIKDIQKKAGYTVPKPEPRPAPEPKPEPEPKAPEAQPAQKEPQPEPGPAPTPARRPPAAATAEKIDMRSVPQSPFITLNAVDQPVDAILYKIARQSDRIIKWEGSGERPRLTVVMKDAFFWEALLEVCNQGRWGFTVFSQPGYPIGIPGSFDAPPPRGYQVVGPLALVWYGLNEESTFDFKQQPPKSIKVKRMALDLRVDKSSGATFEDPATNPDFVFTFAGGRRVTIKADEVMQDGMGGRAWKFHPGGQLTGDTADLEVTIPVWAPTQRREATVPWQNGATTKTGDVNVALDQVSQDKEGKLTANIKLGYDQEVMTRLAQEGGSLGATLLSAHTVAVIGKDGRQVEGDRGSGWSGPGGCGWSANFETPGNFQPAHVAVTWAEGFRQAAIPFNLKGIPISEKATADYKPKPSAAATAKAAAEDRPTPRPPGEPVRVGVKPIPRPGPGFGMVEWAEIKPKESAFGDVSSLCFSPDGKLLAATGFEQACVKIWSVDGPPTEKTGLFGFDGKVCRAVFSPDGRYIAAAGWDGVVKVFDVAGEREVTAWKAHDGLVVSLVFSPDGKRLVCGAFGDNIKILDMTSGKEVRAIEDGGAKAIRFSPDGSVFTSYDWGDGEIRFWDAATGEKVAQVPIPEGGVEDICFSPDGKILAAAGGSSLTLIDAATRQEVMTWRDDPAEKGAWVGIGAIAFSPDGSLVAMGFMQKLVRLWDVKTGQVAATLEGHQGQVKAVAFSPDGGILASGDSNLTIKLWKWK
ncbi:MAG: WD40 repeat domain-containing protein [Planctomycetota bacterium]